MFNGEMMLKYYFFIISYFVFKKTKKNYITKKNTYNSNFNFTLILKKETCD